MLKGLINQPDSENEGWYFKEHKLQFSICIVISSEGEQTNKLLF